MFASVTQLNTDQIASPVDALLKVHQDAFDLVSEGVLWVDAAGRIQHCNERASIQLGYSQNELLRASYFEINPHFSLLGWKKFWNRLQGSQTERLDTEFVNRQGKLFSVKGKTGFDLYAIDPELCLVVFTSSEAGKRDANLLALVQQDANIGSWEINLATGQVYVSSQISQWLGLTRERNVYSAEEFVAHLLERIPKEIYAAARLVYKQLRQSAKSFEYSLPIRDPSADPGTSPTEYLLRGHSEENELEVYKVFGTVAPAEQQTIASVARSFDENILRLALDNQRDAIYAVSYADRKIIYANARATEVTGYTQRELIGAPASMLAPPHLRDQLPSFYDEVKQQRYLEVNAVTQRKDGTQYPTRGSLIYHSAEEGEFMVVISHDQSQENAHSENIQLYTATLDSLREWVIWLNASGEVVLLNDAARKKLRRKTSRNPEGLPIEELMPDLEIPPLSEIRQEQLDGRIRSAIDYIYPNPSGEDRSLQVRFVQVASGPKMFLSLICRDVTVEYSNRRRLQSSRRREVELKRQLESENETLREQIQQVNASGPIITVSKKYQQILAQIAQVAGTDATVLVTGETGTGKELLAQSIHKFSNRSRKPMVSVNCAALPENLIESELFGHERGSFTGAIAQKKGKFELAHLGTIFLDEIGELPLDMQAKLLRVLQEGEIQRIGSTESIHVDVRVVAATNRDLEKMIGQGTFREDLYYRLNVFPIHNLPLRERPEDIPVLVQHFAKVYSERMGRNITQIVPRDLEKLQNYDFPGNVRELINLVERAVITSRDSTLNLGASLRALRRTERNEEGLSFRGEKIISFEAMQRQYIIEALKRTGGKVTGPGGAAELLKLNGRTLMSKMNKLGINRNQFTR